MERIEPIIQPPLGICEQPQCSLNATIRCQTHAKRVCDTCSAIFHYDCDLKIRNFEEYMHAAVEAIEYLVDNTLDEGIRYGLHRTNMDFEESMKELKDKTTEFTRKYQGIKDDAYAIFLCYDESRKLIKDILESHAYHLFSSYKSQMQDSNKLSKAFDEEEAECYDNIRAQLHQKAIKDEQEFRENTLKSLSKDMMTTFNRSIQDMESGFALLKDEYRQRFEAFDNRLVQEARLYREEIRSAKQELLELINKIEGEESTKINDIKKDLNQLTEDSKKDRLFNKSIFDDILKRFNDDKIELSKKIDEASSNLSIKIKSLEANDHDLLNRTKDLDKRLTSTNCNIEKKIDASHKEITKFNDIFAEFKTESKNQFADLKNKQIELKDEFKESKETLNEIKEELNQKITSEISTLSADMMNKFDQMDIKHQNLLQDTSNLSIKIDDRTKISGNN